jgi:outer membrane immunogenic protein
MRPVREIITGLVLGGTLGFAGIGLAHADGMPGRGVVYEKPFSWTGLYVGGNIGWMSADVDWSFPQHSATSTSSTSQTLDSGIVGGHIGYQGQFGAFVVGVEAAFSSSFNQDRESSNCSFPAPFDDRCDTKFVRSLFTVGPRFGWTPSRQWLLFTGVGFAKADINTAIRFGGVGVPPAPNAVPVTQTTRSHDGIYVGGGVEYALLSNVLVGLEYQHVFLETVDHTLTGSGGPPSIVNRNVNADLDIVRFRLSYKFGNREEPRPLK